jgi:hypothetical protein
MKKIMSKILLTFMLLMPFLAGTSILKGNEAFASTIPSLEIQAVGQTTPSTSMPSDNNFFYYGDVTNFQINNHNNITIGTKYPVIRTLLMCNDYLSIGVYVDDNYIGDVSNLKPATSGEMITYQQLTSNSYMNEFILTNLTPETHTIKVMANPLSGSVRLIQNYAAVTVK